MTSPDVTVVIPSLGRPSLQTAVSSALDQKDVRSEVVVVVADPAADTLVRGHLSGLPARVVVASNRCTGGEARNLGVSSSTASFVSFLDDDDWWEPDKLSAQLTLAESMASLHVVVGSRAFFHAASGGIRVLPDKPLGPTDDVAAYLLRRSRVRFGQGFIQTSMLLIDRALALAEPWNPALRRHQDWDLIIRAVNRADTSFAMVERPLVHVAQGSSQSVSISPDWRASLDWVTSMPGMVSGRSRSDFIAAVALRSALAARDRHGVARAVRHFRDLPHAAAIVVAASGLASRRRR